MQAKPKYLTKIENIYFLARIGSSLRWATDHIVREELPKEVQRMLRRLERTETRAAALKQQASNDG